MAIGNMSDQVVLPRQATREGSRMTVSYVLRLSCVDQPGILSAVTTALFSHGGNILEAQQFDDLESGRFFARLQFEGISDGATLERFNAALRPVAARFDMDWSLRPH